MIPSSCYNLLLQSILVIIEIGFVHSSLGACKSLSKPPYCGFIQQVSSSSINSVIFPSTQQKYRDTAIRLHNHADLNSISTLFENDRILAIEKPNGIAHHSENDQLGIMAMLREQMKNESNQVTTGTSDRLYGVHRLDKVTSGILLFAKDEEMAGLLSKAFREKKIVKYYVALSAKKAKKKKQGWVKGIMVPSRRGSWKLVEKMGGGADDNYAATRFFTAGLGNLNNSFSNGMNVNADEYILSLPKTLMLFHPITGKTHQIRVAAKSVGLPILGDERYENTAVNGAFNAHRTYLHASAIHLDMKDIGLPEEGVLTLVSKPSFADLWEIKNNESDESESMCINAEQGFDSILLQLLNKHCSCAPILEKWENMIS